MTAVKPLSIIDILGMKARGEKIATLTAYDASFAAVLDAAGIDVILVGDSLGMVIQGQRTTVPVSLEAMIYHTQCVSRGRQRAFLVADMPFMTYFDVREALNCAAKLVQQGGAQMVKLEGSKFECIRALTAEGIPVCGHLGLLPQSIHKLGAYAVQGKERASADKILEDALEIERAGATMLILECIPAELGRKISQALSIPVIGIGAGVDCDGQVLVLYDMLDIGIGKRPRFSKNFMAGAANVAAAVEAYRQAVKSAEFPAAEHGF